MCLAILKPASAKLPTEKLHNGWIGNPDGAGFAYADGEKVIISKGYMNWKTFLAAYEEAQRANVSSPFLIHFRIRTQGARDESNTHPFLMENGGALIHNGGISGTGANYNDGPSDTAIFVNKFGKVLTFDNVRKHKSKLEAALGHSSKLVMLYPNHAYIIINQQLGQWDEDVWFSNSSFRSRNAGQQCILYGDD